MTAWHEQATLAHRTRGTLVKIELGNLTIDDRLSQETTACKVSPEHEANERALEAMRLTKAGAR